MVVVTATRAVMVVVVKAKQQLAAEQLSPLHKNEKRGNLVWHFEQPVDLGWLIIMGFVCQWYLGFVAVCGLNPILKLNIIFCQFWK